MIDEIIKIERLDVRDTIDIEVEGNHLFYANGILTHNSNSDPELQDTSESFALPATADLFLAAVSTDELAALGQIMFKQLKNRYADLNINKRFVIGVDKSKMRLYDVKPEDQKLVNTAIVPEDDTPVFDNTAAGKRIKRDGLSFDDLTF